MTGAWSGTAHALVAELGVGAATHSTLQLALGVAALLAGLGVVCTVMGIAFIWQVRSSEQEPRTRRTQRIVEGGRAVVAAANA